MMKKIFRIIICLAFILTIHCSAVLADDDASTLSQDMIIEDSIVIENDTVYDLKGHKIYFKEDCSGRVFYVKKGSTLTIKDSEGGGIITGGASLGGNVYETDIYDFGRGEVRDITEGCGGGVYVEKGAKLIMTGGKITGNRAEQGGGVYLENGAELHVSGSASITGNCYGDTDTIADNVFLPFDSEGKQSEIIVDDTLSNTALIGITPATRSADTDKEIVVTSGLNNHGIAANFTSDEGKPVYLNNSGEIVFNMGKAAASVTYSVTISAGSNMTKTTDSGAASQPELSDAMEDVVYMANDGYYFPENYVDSCTVTANSGISVTRNSYTQITVSGTPTADAAITLTAPTAKTTPDAPTGLTATKASSSNATDGTISGVSDAMEYHKDGDTAWTAVENNKTEITGLTSGTYKIRYAGTADKNASPAATVEVGVKLTQTITASDVTATYGDTGKNVSASVTDPAEGRGAISYAVKSGSENYIDVNASTGALTIKAVPPTDGKAYVIVTAAETNDYAKTTKEVAVTINKAEVTVTAKDQNIYVGGTVPDLSSPVLDTHYTVTGLVGDDTLTTGPILAYRKDGNAATPDNTAAGTYDIVASGASAGDNYAISYTKGTLTISQKPSGGGSGSGEGSGTTYTVPVTNESTVQVNVSINNGNVAVNEIQAEDIAKITTGGDDQKPVDTINIDLSGASVEVTSIELTKSTVENLADAVSKNENLETVTVVLSNAVATLDQKTLETMVSEAKGNTIKLVVDDVEQTKLNDKQQDALKAFGSAEPFEVYFESNGHRISDFGGGRMAISLKFTPATGRDPKNYFIAYLNPDGSVKQYPSTFKDGAISTVIDHNSEYAVVYDDSRDKAAARKVKIKSAKAKKGRKALVKWKRLKGVSGYQIAYSTSKKFSKKTTKRVTASAKSAKKTIKKLKAGKRYYVKVRSYNKIYDPAKEKKVNVYGKWSKAKKVKAKR